MVLRCSSRCGSEIQLFRLVFGLRYWRTDLTVLLTCGDSGGRDARGGIDVHGKIYCVNHIRVLQAKQSKGCPPGNTYSNNGRSDTLE